MIVCSLPLPACIYLASVISFESTGIVARIISSIHKFSAHRAYLHYSDCGPYMSNQYAVSTRRHIRNTTYSMSIQICDVTQERTRQHLSPSSDGRVYCSVCRPPYGPKVRSLSMLTCCRKIETTPEPPSTIEPPPGPSATPWPSAEWSRHITNTSTYSEPLWSLNEPPAGPSEAPSHRAERMITNQLRDSIECHQILAEAEDKSGQFSMMHILYQYLVLKLAGLESHCMVLDNFKNNIGAEIDKAKGDMDSLKGEINTLRGEMGIRLSEMKRLRDLVCATSFPSGMLPTPNAWGKGHADFTTQTQQASQDFQIQTISPFQALSSRVFRLVFQI
jgi:hypothetical protein